MNGAAEEGTYFFHNGFQIWALHAAGFGVGGLAQGGFGARGGEVGEDFVVG